MFFILFFILLCFVLLCFLYFSPLCVFCFLGGLGLGNACPALDYHPARPPARLMSRNWGQKNWHCGRIPARNYRPTEQKADRMDAWIESVMGWMHHSPARRFHIAEYQADDQVRTACRHRGANRSGLGRARSSWPRSGGSRPTDWLGGIEVGRLEVTITIPAGTMARQWRWVEWGTHIHTHTHTHKQICNAWERKGDGCL